ncbi:MAG: hypothetical protein CVU29_10535 [Betaproteobacteria bacterium HGW-Betaproteobacteria-22]|nr:MAG: hypothetical protein CVU29_10535 [Betaproteobacteria bacterium HGW-Betaproteobacteria-22]
MNRKAAIIIGLQAFLIVMLFWLLVFYGKDEFEALNVHDDDEIETPQRVVTKEGTTTVHVSAATQAQSGIYTTPLEASSHQASISTYGNVLSIDGLIELRSRYLAAANEIDAHRASLTHSKSEWQRLKVLNLDDKNVSDKAVAAALANVKSDELRISSIESQLKSIQESLLQNWGKPLTALATQRNAGSLLQALISNQSVLIQTTLPFDITEPKPNSTIMVAPTAAPSHTIKANYISPAPISNNTIQGKTYFYQASSAELRAGMQVNAITSTSNKKTEGVIVPNNAIVWYAGKPWVYLKKEEDLFIRLPISTDVEVEEGWFHQGTLKADDEVVTSGAQLLLSEEFKSQITNENDD